MARNDIKKAVITAAMPLFARFGFKKTSVDELARAAHVAKATLYAHFENKEAIFAEVVRAEGQRVFAAMDAAVAQAASHEERLRGFFTGFVDAIEASELIQHTSSEVLIELLPLAHDVDKELEEAGHERLRRLVKDGVDAGAFMVDDIDDTVRALDLALFSMHLTMLDRDPQRVRRDLPALLQLLLRGLRASAPAED